MKYTRFKARSIVKGFYQKKKVYNEREIPKVKVTTFKARSIVKGFY